MTMKAIGVVLLVVHRTFSLELLATMMHNRTVGRLNGFNSLSFLLQPVVVLTRGFRSANNFRPVVDTGERTGGGL